MLRGHGYLLCFDDLHFVEGGDLLHVFNRAIDSATQAGELDVIVTSECTPSLVKDKDDFDPLLGLNWGETRDFFAKALPAEAEMEETDPHSTQTLIEMQTLTDAELIVNLHARTEGNPTLLRYALDALDPDHSPSPNRVHFLMHLYEDKDISRFLMEKIEENLKPEESAVMRAVAILQGQSGTRDAIEAILGGENVWCALRDLVDRHLLQKREPDREYSMTAIIRHFYYGLLSKRERKAMHRRAGKYYETEEPDVLKAARHFAEAEEYERAARLVTRDVRALVNEGQDRSLRRLLDKLVKEELASEQKAQVYRARGEFNGLQGEHELARENYEQALSALDTLPDSGSVRELKARVRQAMSDLEHHEKSPARPQ
jgi:ATP/maltotriose-dependent transcriptional regulator MalT